MPVCVTQAVDGSLAVDAGRTDFSTCQYVLDTGSDYSGLHALANLTIPEAQLIAGHIAAVWAVAWGFRQIANAVRQNS
jgi:hypothetical protein